MSQPSDLGAGHPDFALYTANQLRGATLAEPLPEQPPERGVLEAKPPARNLDDIAGTEQVTRYWERHGLVLVSNFHAFLLVGRDQFGRRVNLEYFDLAEGSEAFWALAAEPGAAPGDLAPRFVEFVKRALLHNARISQPKDVAWFLASYARDALARIEAGRDLDGVKLLRTTLEEALGMKFEGERGGHFFHSTLVQTLFYGLFSAWVLWCKKNPEPEARKGFDGMGAAWQLRLPVLRALFEQINTPGRLGALNLVELVDWAAGTLRRVDDAAFFATFEESDAVQYFYEPFLADFDPELRKQLGVWYTPPEVVDYMVERVDQVLRSELGIADGLADERVLVLDPCCGTGSYLVAVLQRIARTPGETTDDALIGADIKEAVMERIFGFEILPAPFVVAHLQIGLLMEGLGVEFDPDKDNILTSVERAGIYLTNAMTGWAEVDRKGQYLFLPELEDEMYHAGKVKRDKPILVVLGNPPYNGYAGVAVEEERELSETYRTTRRVRAPEGQGLNDLYVRFFRMAERRIAEGTGKGIVCFISNYSWLDGLSFTGMREALLDAFDHLWIDCLNGDKYKTGKLTPEGDPDPSIFSTEFNRAGIQVGTAISLMARHEDHVTTREVRFRQLWGKDKRAQLAREAGGEEPVAYDCVTPNMELGLPFLPGRVDARYFSWPLLPDLFPVSFPGVQTGRDQFLVDIDREKLEYRIDKYFNPAVSDEDMEKISPAAMKRSARFKAREVRDFLKNRDARQGEIIRYCYRPFDIRWLYWEPETKLLDEKRSEYVSQIDPKNPCLMAVEKPRRENPKTQVISHVGCRHLMERGANIFPAFLKGKGAEVGESLFDALEACERHANLSDGAGAYLDGLEGAPLDLFYHCVAVLHAVEFEAANFSALRQDWPRIPLPATAEALRASAELGREVATLLDPESPLEGVSAGKARPELAVLGAIRRVDGGNLGEKHLYLTAGWGHAGQNGVTMPGHGRSEARDFTEEEQAALDGVGTEAAVLLGGGARDVYLNEDAYWSSIPEAVWSFTIGGYQVIKKWLSYREYDLLGRPLSTAEARHVTAMTRRIAALILAQPQLDANYHAIREDTFVWGTVAD